MEPLLKVANLSVKRGSAVVVRNINLELPAGEITSIVGSNGAGKTTILNAIAGTLRSESGVIHFDGAQIDFLSVRERVSKGLVLVPQERMLFGSMSVADNLKLGAHSRTRNEIEEAEEFVLRLFPVLKEKYYQPAGTLSGGQQQMVAIARGLMAKPKLLMLDEPSFGLAPRVVSQIMACIEDINRLGTTILLVEQNVSTAFSVAKYVYVVENGNVVRCGLSKDLRDDESIREAYLGI